MDLEAELGRILREAARLWNAHRFFECHDKLEEAWRLTKHEKKAEPPADPRRDVFHGLILYAAAYVHWAKGNTVGVGRKLADARRLLESAQSRLPGFDLTAFRRAVDADLGSGAAGAPYVAGRVPRMATRKRAAGA